MTTYAVVAGTMIVNVVVCDDATYASQQGWVAITTTPGSPGIGWTTTDGGKTWVEPSPATPLF